MGSKMKILSIGLNKTGTKSLTMAMAKLGYNSYHVNPFCFHDSLKKAKENIQKLLHYLEPYTFLSDIWIHTGLTIKKYNNPFYYSFEYKYNIINTILKQYKNVYLINNIRNYEDWILSRKKHIKNCKGHWNIFNENDIKYEYEQQSKLINKLKEIPEIKILDFEIGKHGYKELCLFLNKPIIKDDFPWKKKQREEYKKKYIVENNK